MKLNLIKCHLAYLLSKSNIIIMIVISMILIIMYLSNSISSDYLTVKENVNNYYEASIAITKIIYCVMANFMMANFYAFKNDAYLALLIVAGVKRQTYFLTKLISLFISLLVVIFILWIWWMLFGFIFIKGFVYEDRFIYAFLTIYFNSLIYSLYSCILVIITNNMFTFLIPSIASIFTSSLVQNSKGTLTKVLLLVIPASTKDHIYPFYGYGIEIVHIIILTLIACLIYTKTDRKLE